MRGHLLPLSVMIDRGLRSTVARGAQSFHAALKSGLFFALSDKLSGLFLLNCSWGEN